MRVLMLFLLLALVVTGCGHDYITRPAAQAAPSDSTAAPCPDDDED